MKRTDETDPNSHPPIPVSRRAHAGKTGSGLLLVHPLTPSGADILSIAVHLLHRFATAHRKDVPELSEDAAQFLRARRWAVGELAARLSRAVASNRGSLITAADLLDPLP